MGLLQVGRGHLIVVATLYRQQIQHLYDQKNRDFENWPLNRGCPLNTGPLYTGSTVLFDRYMYESVKVRVTC